jgi:hypothetical protein
MAPCRFIFFLLMCVRVAYGMQSYDGYFSNVPEALAVRIFCSVYEEDARQYYVPLPNKLPNYHHRSIALVNKRWHGIDEANRWRLLCAYARAYFPEALDELVYVRALRWIVHASNLLSDGRTTVVNGWFDQLPLMVQKRVRAIYYVLHGVWLDTKNSGGKEEDLGPYALSLQNIMKHYKKSHELTTGTLHLGNNKLESVDGISMVPYACNLRCLTLDKNSLESLPVEIAVFKHLVVLDVSDNKLTDLPPATAFLKRLQSLPLRNNCFSVFPEVLYELTGLEQLFLTKNQIGNVSKKLSNLTRLTTLSLNSLLGNPLDKESRDVINALITSRFQEVIYV